MYADLPAQPALPDDPAGSGSAPLEPPRTAEYSQSSTLESLAPRLGDALVREGLITQVQLDQALAWQAEQEEGRRPLLGQALVALGLISSQALDGAVARQLSETQAALQNSNRQLEQRVQQRTLDLERRLLEIRTAAEITEIAVAAASLPELFQRAADLLVDRFGFSAAAVFMVDESQKYLVLAEMAGQDKATVAAVLNQPPQILIGGRSLIGWAAANRQPRVAGDVSQDFFYAPSAELSDTRSEAAIPILAPAPLDQGSEEGVGDRFYFHRQAAEALVPVGRVLGVLDLQDRRLNVFDSDRVAVLQTIAGHLAAVMQNIRLLEAARLSLNETAALFRAGQELSQARQRSDVYRVLAQALERLEGPALLLVPVQPASDRFVSGDMPLQPFASPSTSSRPRTDTSAVAGGAGSHSGADWPALTVSMVDAALPAPEYIQSGDHAFEHPRVAAATSEQAQSGASFLLIDTRQPGTYPAAFLAYPQRMGVDVAVFVALRQGVSAHGASGGGRQSLAALLVAGEAPALAKTTSASEHSRTGASAKMFGAGLGVLRREALVQICASLAELGAGALARLAASEVMEKRFAALQSLNTVSQFISLQMDLNDLYAAIHAEVQRIMGDVDFIIAIYDPESHYIRIPYMFEKTLEGEQRIQHIDPFPLGQGLTSIVINTRQPLMLVRDTERRTRELGAITVGRSSKSWLGVPLLVGGEVIGAMIVQDAEVEGRFDEDDQRLLATLGSQVATAIRTARLLDSTHRQAERQRALYEITAKLRSTNDFQTVLDTAALELRKILGAARVRLEVDPLTGSAEGNRGPSVLGSQSAPRPDQQSIGATEEEK